MKMLVVVSPTLSPLSTVGPLPTDGLPEWWECSSCGHTRRDADEPCGECASRSSSWVGPYPFTVAVWQELPCDCGEVTTLDAVYHEPFCSRGGAVVATVEVTDRGHRGSPDCALYPCGRGDLDCWHTPTSTVTRLDVPIPTERPMQEVVTDGPQPAQHEAAAPEDSLAARRAEVRAQRHDTNDPWSAQEGSRGQEPRYAAVAASWWWADLTLEVPA